MMLADPAFREAQFIEPTDHLEIPLVAVFKRPFRGVRRHREISELHRFLLGILSWKSTTIIKGSQGLI
jgi:hypothetical protein